ncbi:MAG TPA: DUF3168 domain-containing protein [Ramlibacter sp.]
MSAPVIAREILEADATLIATIPAARIIIGVVPQGTALPCIGITEVSTTDHLTVGGHRGGTVKVTSRVQITVMATTYVACRSAMLMARRAARDFVGTAGSYTGVTCRLDGQGPDFMTEAGFCAQTQDLRITYNESPS